MEGDELRTMMAETETAVGTTTGTPL
jgi:hypothetical protein